MTALSDIPQTEDTPMSNIEDQIAAIRAQLAEDERVARAATQGIWKLWAMSVMADQDGRSDVDTAVLVANTFSPEHSKPLTFNAEHIARWDPKRVLAEIAAKRRILDAWPTDPHDPTLRFGDWTSCGDDCVQGVFLEVVNLLAGVLSTGETEK